MAVLAKQAARGPQAPAQINVRIDRVLKESGDLSLAEVGLSPSDAVRALWEAMARRGETRDALLLALGLRDAPAELEDRKSRRRLLVERIAARYEHLGKGGVDPSSLPAIDEDGWEELAWEDFQTSRDRGDGR